MFYHGSIELLHDHYRTYLKDVLKEESGTFFYIGLMFERGEVLTFDNKVVGKAEDVANDFTEGYPNVMVDTAYDLSSNGGQDKQPFVCQHN